MSGASIGQRRRVLKLGGRATEAPGASREFAADLASLGGGTIVVHGGGAEVSAWSGRMGLVPRFVDGLRVTDSGTLEVAAAVLAGLANKRLVAEMRGVGVNAVGLAALDAGIAEVVPHPRAAELGLVAEVKRIETALLESLLASGYVPVLASIAALEGRLLNVNADDFATALAIALGADDLVLLTDTPGVRIEGRMVPSLGRDALALALTHPEVSGGMKAKLEAARRALEGGVRRVTIAQWSGPGTLARLEAGDLEATRIEANTEPSHA